MEEKMPISIKIFCVLILILFICLITTEFCHANNKKITYKESIKTISKIEQINGFPCGYQYVIQTTDGNEFTVVNKGTLFDEDFEYGDDYIEYTKSHDKKQNYIKKIYINKKTAEKLNIRIFEYEEPKFKIETEYIEE